MAIDVESPVLMDIAKDVPTARPSHKLWIIVAHIKIHAVVLIFFALKWQNCFVF